MSEKNVISPMAQAQQRINAMLRNNGEDIPGASEISDSVQDDLDMQFFVFKKMKGAENASMADLVSVYSEFIDYMDGRPLTKMIAARLSDAIKQYSLHEVVAIIDHIKLSFFELNVITEEPELQVNWITTNS